MQEDLLRRAGECPHLPTRPTHPSPSLGPILGTRGLENLPAVPEDSHIVGRQKQERFPPQRTSPAKRKAALPAQTQGCCPFDLFPWTPWWLGGVDRVFQRGRWLVNDKPSRWEKVGRRMISLGPGACTLQGARSCSVLNKVQNALRLPEEVSACHPPGSKLLKPPRTF